MKTTVEIADPLLEQAKALARRRGVTLRDLIELALRRVIDEERPARPFRLKKATFGGKGLQPGGPGGDE